MEADGVNEWSTEDFHTGQNNEVAIRGDDNVTLAPLGELLITQGVCGLNNLGNTCFMNSGLQCLLSNSTLVKFFLEDSTIDEVFLESLTGRFAELLTKIWQGKYSILDPSSFKEYLGIYHPQFKDYRQHDCQEFLALLLDSLHEQLNKAPAKQDSADSENQDISGDGCCSALPPSTSEFRTGCPDNTLLSYSQKEDAERIHTVTAAEAGCEHSISEDSNQSTVSDNSSTLTEEVNSLRMASIPDNMKHNPKPVLPNETSSQSLEVSQSPLLSGVASSQVMNSCDFEIFKREATACGLPICNSIVTGKVNSLTLPDIEEFYMKDSKTLNTNVLVEEFDHEIVTTDSDKFLKQDNTLRQPDPLENIGESFSDTKPHSPKGVKDTNLLANMREKFTDPDSSDNTMKCLFRDHDDNSMEESNCNINNVKRMKTDGDQKNIRLQAKRKMNTARNLTSEDNVNISNMVSMNNQITESAMLSESAVSLQQLSHVQELRNAELAWRKYLFKNKSIIVDQFQGQFKSTVICANCQHISVTYEPFMYLSVPLPHALERQISVIFVPSDSKPTVCHLITLNKRDTVVCLRTKLLEQIGDESCDVILAEVFDNHIARILENTTMLRFIDDTNRTVYAFEMIPPPLLDEPESLESDNKIDTSQHSNNEEPLFQPSSDQPQDIFSGVQFFSAEVLQVETNAAKSPTTTKETNKSDWKSGENAVYNDFEARDPDWSPPVSIEGNMIWNDTEAFGCNKAADDMTGTNIWKSDVASAAGTWDEVPLQSSGIADAFLSQGSADTCSAQTKEPGSGNKKVDNVNISSDGWRSCVICLEEKLDSEMKIHSSCGGTLCQGCLEMSFIHYGEAAFVCPVCSVPVNPAEDFIMVLSSNEPKPRTRILSMPVSFRYDSVVDCQVTRRLFGHPSMVYVLSCMSGESLYDIVDRVVPLTASYTVILTDGQGYHCSRCMYTNHCSGCEVVRDGEVSLHPGDHLTVRFDCLTEEQIESAHNVVDHPSMKNLRSKDPLTLFDCLSAFTDSEILDEHNPWYCPHCRRNQCANKTMTVWQYPETLIIQLKRFVFHDLSSSKLDNKVVFPLEDLDMSNFISGPNNSDLSYDLQSCVCHFGGVNTGHYTAYAKHPASNKWYHYNDEIVTGQTPHDDIFSSAYVLFFQKQGTQVDLKISEEPGFLPKSIFSSEKTSHSDTEQDEMTKILEGLNNVTKPHADYES